MNQERSKACARVRRELPFLIGGDEAGLEHPDLWQHLRACPDCRHEFAAFRQSQRALKSLAPMDEPTPGFFARLQRDTLAAISLEPVHVFGVRTGPWGRRALARRLLAAAALIACAIVVARWGRQDPPGTKLLHRPALVTSGARPLLPASGWVVPVSFTPSGQGLRGLQKLTLDPLEPVGAKSTR